MPIPDKSLKFMAKNAVVADFKRLVDEALGIKSSSSSNKTSILSRNEALLDIELHDKAYNMPEAKTVSLKKQSVTSSKQYGTFNGATVFKDWYGTVDKDVKITSPLKGWLTLNRNSFIYAKFSNSEVDYIIRFSDFIPDDIVEDFQPLYDKLLELKHNKDESVLNDTENASSKAVTNKVDSSEMINNDSDNVDDLSGETNNSDGGQINGSSNISRRDDSVYNTIQAVIYDLPDFSYDKDSFNDSFSRSDHHLLCYQQPENISYTAAAQYDSIPTRGSQQPYQFYVAANAMNLNFTLKWHIDEIRTLRKQEVVEYTIQDIAQIAEDFTRPWNTGTSIQPKLCKVILPGISQIGYITEAQISYSGDMAGDSTASESGVLDSSGNIRSEGGAGCVYNYFYSQIEVTFTMIIVKDVKLFARGEDRWNTTYTVGNDDVTVGSDAVQSENEQAKDEVVNESVDVQEPNTAEESVNNSQNYTPLNEAPMSVWDGT